MDAREESSCLSRVIINHDPTNYSAGLKFNIVTRLVDKLLCVSEAQRSIVVGHGGEISKTLVMKNGVDTNLFLYGNPDKRDYMNLVYAGVLIFEKGIHVLINSFGQLKQEFPNLKLDIYGRDGGWKVIDNQKDQIESSMPGLKFHGAVSQATLAKAFQNAGACVVPSISFDSCPLVCLDALASGCPVVGFNIGGIPELITHNSTGIIVDSPTPEALTANLSQLLKNPDSLKQMSVNCESLCRNRTWATYTKELVALCENIAHSKSSQTNIVQNDSIGSDVLQKVALNLKNSIEGQGHFAHQLK